MSSECKDWCWYLSKFTEFQDLHWFTLKLCHQVKFILDWRLKQGWNQDFRNTGDMSQSPNPKIPKIKF